MFRYNILDKDEILILEKKYNIRKIILKPNSKDTINIQIIFNNINDDLNNIIFPINILDSVKYNMSIIKEKLEDFYYYNKELFRKIKLDTIFNNE